MRSVRKKRRPRPTEPALFHIYVDADACPVKPEIYKVATRYCALVYLVSNQPLRPPISSGLNVKVIQVKSGADEADKWIYEQIRALDICVTADIPLAAKCIDQGAFVLTPRGNVFTSSSVSQALASRDLMTSLRESDWGGSELPTGGPPPMTQRDRSQFLNALDRVIQQSRKASKLKRS